MNLAPRPMRASAAARPAPPLRIPFGPWRPDLPDHDNPGATAANGVIPQAGSYGPVPGLAPVYNALAGRCLGAARARDAAGNAFVYAGDARALYEGVGERFADRSARAYATAAGDVWEFAVWEPGKLVMATNHADPVQSLGVGRGASDGFADMIASAARPRARRIAVMRNFVVLGDCWDAEDGARPARVWWSAINAPADFDPDAATQCDFEDLASGGRVQKLLGGAEYGVILQEGLIRRMHYVGSPLVWSFPIADKDRGAAVPGAAIQHGRTVFYLAESGFFAFDGHRSHAIGEGKVDRTFWRQFDLAHKGGVSAGIDPRAKLVCWSFPAAGAPDGRPNKIYFYKWDDGAWSEADLDAECLTGLHAPGYDLEGLDALGRDIDDAGAFALSFDSDAWKRGEARFAGFDRAHRLGYFAGANLAATLETGELRLFPGRAAHVRRVRPLVDGGRPAIAVAGRRHQADRLRFGPAVEAEPDGACPVRDRSRFQRFRLSLPAGGDWRHAQGVEVSATPSGRR